MQFLGRNADLANEVSLDKHSHEIAENYYRNCIQMSVSESKFLYMYEGVINKVLPIILTKLIIFDVEILKSTKFLQNVNTISIITSSSNQLNELTEFLYVSESEPGRPS